MRMKITREIVDFENAAGRVARGAIRGLSWRSRDSFGDWGEMYRVDLPLHTREFKSQNVSCRRVRLSAVGPRISFGFSRFAWWGGGCPYHGLADARAGSDVGIYLTIYSCQEPLGNETNCWVRTPVARKNGGICESEGARAVARPGSAAHPCLTFKGSNFQTQSIKRCEVTLKRP